MLEAQKILHLGHMNNQTTKEHGGVGGGGENAPKTGLHKFFSPLIRTHKLSLHFRHHIPIQVASPNICEAS